MGEGEGWVGGGLMMGSRIGDLCITVIPAPEPESRIP